MKPKFASLHFSQSLSMINFVDDVSSKLKSMRKLWYAVVVRVYLKDSKILCNQNEPALRIFFSHAVREMTSLNIDGRHK